MSTDHAIATPTFDARPHIHLVPDEHNPAVPAQSAKSYEDLMRENMKLRASIREAESRIMRMLNELDATIAKLTAAGGGK